MTLGCLLYFFQLWFCHIFFRCIFFLWFILPPFDENDLLQLSQGNVVFFFAVSGLPSALCCADGVDDESSIVFGMHSQRGYNKRKEKNRNRLQQKSGTLQVMSSFPELVKKDAKDASICLPVAKFRGESCTSMNGLSIYLFSTLLPYRFVFYELQWTPLHNANKIIPNIDL